MGKTIYIVGGQKGGVGKTSVCQALCQHLLDKERAFALVEGDAQIDDVGRMYRGEVETETVNISDDPAKASNPDVIYSRALQDNKDVVVNLPSNIIDVMTSWLKTTGLISILKEKFGGDIRLVKLFVSDGCYESIRQLEKSVKSLDGQIPHVVVLNEGRVSAADFSYLEQQELYTSLKTVDNFLGVVTFPAMEPGTQFYIDSQGKGLRKALEETETDSDFLRGQRIKNFIDQINGVFDEAQKLIDDWFPKQADWNGTGKVKSSKPAASDSSSKGFGGDDDSNGDRAKDKSSGSDSKKLNVKAGAAS